MLDTSVLIDAEREGLTVSALLVRVGTRWPGADVSVSVISVGEILYGIWRADSQARRSRRQAYIDELLAEIPIIPVTINIIRVFAELDAHADSVGLPRPMEDLLIAASAIYRKDDVVTGNVRHFEVVPGLVVHQWE